jgi:dinuclear metal center YbgI/SA1388 family protein
LLHKVQDIYEFIDSFAPFDSALNFDNVGLLVGDMQKEVSSVLLALDLNKAVLKEAINSETSLIICHHPIIWKPLRRIECGGVIGELLRHNVSVIAAHTNLDIAPGGVSSCLADLLGLVNRQGLKVESTDPSYTVSVYVPTEHVLSLKRAMVAAGAGELGNYRACSFTSGGVGSFVPLAKADPYVGALGVETAVNETKLEMFCKCRALASVIAAIKSAHPYEEPAFNVFKNHGVNEELSFGVVGDLEESMRADVFLKHVTRSLQITGCRYFLPDEAVFKRVACLGGSGSNLLEDAVRAGADVFVTGDVAHHVWYEAERHNIGLIDAGHFATENPVILCLKEKLQEQFEAIKCKEAEGNVALEHFFVPREGITV